MDVKEITLLIDAVSKAEIKNFHLQTGDFQLVMDKSEQPIGTSQQAAVATMVVEPVKKEESTKVQTNVVVESVVENNKKESYDSSNCVEVKSPIVGTYYSAASPDAPPFAKVGDTVKKGQTLCIIEAMKLMNDIECEVDGEIVEVHTNNEDMVEYGQTLFTIRKF